MPRVRGHGAHDLPAESPPPDGRRLPGERALKPNEMCFCGSGLKYKKCCKEVGKIHLVRDHDIVQEQVILGGGKKAAKVLKEARASARAMQPPLDGTEHRRISLYWYDKVLLMFFAVSGSLNLIHYLADVDTSHLGLPVQLMLLIHPMVLVVIFGLFGAQLLWPSWTPVNGLAANFGVFVGLTMLTLVYDMYQ